MRCLLFVFFVFSLTPEAFARRPPPCPRTCRNRMDRLGKRIRALEQNPGIGASGSGAVYIRWGRTTCPPQNELLYEGLAAGSFYAHSGGGANYLCLPTEPQKADVPDAARGCDSFIYGAEYEVCTAGKGIFGTENHENFHDQDVPCAVCQARRRQSHVFLPARTECPAGWTKEYGGYIMGAHHSHQRTEWVCVDASPEARSQGKDNKDGALFYFAEAQCGRTLPCPPYEHDKPFACVVCTK